MGNINLILLMLMTLLDIMWLDQPDRVKLVARIWSLGTLAWGQEKRLKLRAPHRTYGQHYFDFINVNVGCYVAGPTWQSEVGAQEHEVCMVKKAKDAKMKIPGICHGQADD